MMSEFDGVRPKNAICPECRYQFGGIPIVQGCLTCPECGHAFSLSFPGRSRSRGAGVVVLILPIVSVIALAILLGAVSGSTRIGLTVFGIGTALVMLMGWLRRSILEK